VRDVLFQKLTALAYFLATLHNRTAHDSKVDFNKECDYFDQVMNRLLSAAWIGWDQAQDLYRLKNQWRDKACMWEDCKVLIHGDVTPDNVLFGDGLWVIMLDLERMKSSDRVFDLGRVAGELQHFFLQQAGDKSLAEPFIGHFLWEYSCHFPDRDAAFAAITRRLPFYAALTLLRISRNAWIDGTYRKRLLDEARKTLA
jgi:aminoglycoside phosphotransferase (APT) family kinase protein